MSVESGGRNTDPNQGDMPGARMDANSPEEQMPSGSMETNPARGSSGMPESQMEGDAGAPRFISDTVQPGDRPPAAWEPGVVEVQFRDDVAAEITGVAFQRVTRRAPLDREVVEVGHDHLRHRHTRVQHEVTVVPAGPRPAGTRS